MLLNSISLCNDILVLIFGFILSVEFAGGCEKPQRRQLMFVSLVMLAAQGILHMFLGVEAVKQFYPVIVHLPLILLLMFYLKKRPAIALVSVMIAYLCCQLPRFSEIAVLTLTGSAVLSEFCYLFWIVVIFVLLTRLFVQPVRNAMNYSTRTLMLFGSVPLFYYLFDYATTVYSDWLYLDFEAIHEFVPTALIIFYMTFLTAYHNQLQSHAQSKLETSLLEAELKQAENEMQALRRYHAQTAIYQHDMRHHLTMLQGYLTAGQFKQAEDYIHKVRSDIEAIIPKRYCENETINLLCSAFSERAASLHINLEIKANVPAELSISDTELCSLLSNALENAGHAVMHLEKAERHVSLYCEVKHRKLLIDVRNPYAGTIELKDGIPTTSVEGHGYGLQSIKSICEKNRGLYSFELESQLFILRIMLPIE